MALRNGLKTRAQLAAKKISLDTTCALCRRSHEDIQHLLKDCCFSSAIWSLISTKLRIVVHIQAMLIVSLSCKTSFLDARLARRTILF